MLRPTVVRSALPWAALALLATECSLDERRLAGVTVTTGGFSGTGVGKGGGSGTGKGGSASTTGGRNATDGGEAGDGGTGTNQGGFSGTPSGGSAGASAGSGNAASSGGSGGSGGSAGSGGSGGKAMDIGNCADLDTNGERDCDETLVDNSTFDSDTTGWAPSDGAEQVWSDEDARDRSASGSIRVTNNQHSTGGGRGSAASEQCVEIEGGKTYRLLARVLVASSASTAASPAVYIWYYDSSDCTGSLRASYNSFDVVQRGSWQLISVNAASPASPVPARSARFRLAAEKNFSDPNFDVLFDDVLVKAVEAE